MRRFFIKRNKRKERGLTLVELLVVGVIVVLLTAISLPMVKPMLESQTTRSGAQVVSTYLNRAKYRAMTSGRPCGVRFEHYDGSEGDGNGSAALIIRQVTVPPAYSGLVGGESLTVSATSIAALFNDNSLDNSDVFVVSASTNPKSDPIINRLLPKLTGSRIRLGSPVGDSSEASPCVGPYYLLEPLTTRDSSDSLWFNRTDSTYNWSSNLSDFTGWTPMMRLRDNPTCSLATRFPRNTTPGDPLANENYNCSFKALLTPKTSMAAPSAMPQGTVVDLQFSGQKNGYYANSGDVTILFGPTGEVDTINGEYPDGLVHLLVGRWDQISAVREEYAQESFPNYADGRNYWVTINPRTGVIVTSEVNPTNDLGYSPDSNAISNSREFANNTKRNIGGQ